MKNKFFITESEKNKILEMHKKAIRKEFLFEADNNPTGSTTPTGTTVNSGSTADNDFEKNKEIWKGMTPEERKTKVEALLTKVDGLLKTKVTEKIQDVAKDVKLKLIVNQNLHFVLMSNGNPFYYDFGDHTKTLTTYIGEPKVIEDSGSGPDLPDTTGNNKMLLGSSSYDSQVIADDIVNSLDGFEKFIFTSFTFIKQGENKYKMYDIVSSLPLPVAITPFGTEDMPGRGNLYFTESTNDCSNNPTKFVSLDTEFESSKLFNINSVPDNTKFVCTRFSNRVFKVANNNLTITSPDFNNYLATIKEKYSQG